MPAPLDFPPQLFRSDPLTGSSNLLGFAEWLTENFHGQACEPWSLLYLDANFFAELNEQFGQEHGDRALRWIALLLQDETSAPLYRIGGDEFAVTLTEGEFADHTALARRAFDRFNREAAQWSTAFPAVSIAVIHYDAGEHLAPADVLTQLNSAMTAVKQDRSTAFYEFDAKSLASLDDPRAIRRVADRLLERLVSLGGTLDEALHLAYTDSLTGLPNSRAASQRLERSVAQCLASGGSVAVLIIDGDNLNSYNKISYSAGDKMIQRLGSALMSRLRPGDFLARWRMGDEFLVILHGATLEQGLAVGQRFAAAVRESSRQWPMPVTISIGVAACPQHGESVETLLYRAEQALKRAKANGKDQVVGAD